MKRHVLNFSLLIALGATLPGCGAGPGPDLSGPNGAQYLAAYSGDWVLLRLESDDLMAMSRERMDAAGRGTPGGAGGNMPGGGGGVSGGRPGGMTGGRPGGGRGGMPGGQMGIDPEEMQRIMRATRFLAQPPTELSLILRPESVSLSQALPQDKLQEQNQIQQENPPLVLTLEADETPVIRGDIQFFAKAEWTSEGLVIKRKVEGGGGVEDKIHLDDEGRLVVERAIDTGRSRVEGTLRYRRSEG